jgi:hypothetical protein
MFNEIREDAINALIDCLEDGYEGDYNNLHDEVFNSDYYVYANYIAKMILGDEVFEAIGKVQDYEIDRFGTVTTDLSCPSDVINALYYIIGEEIMTDIYDYYYGNVDEEMRQEMLETLKEMQTR